MENEKTGFFQEKANHNSAARLIFIVGSFWNMAFTTSLAFAFEGVTVMDLVLIFTSIESALLAIKVGQKIIEVKGK
jgi:hypothetical protein